MSDRLSELLRQRTLLQEHLAWLDREIAAASGQKPVPSTPVIPAAAPLVPPAPSPVPVAAAMVGDPRAATVGAPETPVPTEPAALAAVADEILEQYRVAPQALKSDVKKGCFIYLFAAFALIALGAIGFYFALHHD